MHKQISNLSNQDTNRHKQTQTYTDQSPEAKSKANLIQNQIKHKLKDNNIYLCQILTNHKILVYVWESGICTL